MYHVKCPVDYTTANDIAVQDGMLTTMEFAECFGELLDAQTIAEATDPEGELMYYVTERGEHVVTALQDSLLSSIRERGLRSASRYLSFKQKGTKLDTEITKREDGMYTLRCTITEKHGILLDISIAVPTSQQAERMAYNFNDNPEEIYREVIHSMKGGTTLY
ncbi:MAG: DUF4364 family protein [Clostridia bacterium]|nr:DUF4364 family protein [Clostridia bacterium]